MAAPVAKSEARKKWKELLINQSGFPSAQVCKFLLSEARFQTARQIAIFAARAGEVDLMPLWQARPDACVFPRVLPKPQRQLEFLAIDSLEDLQPGSLGILEPKKGRLVTQWKPEDWILVPGMAFDRSGGRVGTGAGYYDRFLANNPAVRWGVCWQNQIVPGKLAQEPTDVRMDALCTEQGIVVVD